MPNDNPKRDTAEPRESFGTATLTRLNDGTERFIVVIVVVLLAATALLILWNSWMSLLRTCIETLEKEKSGKAEV